MVSKVFMNNLLKKLRDHRHREFVASRSPAGITYMLTKEELQAVAEYQRYHGMVFLSWSKVFCHIPDNDSPINWEAVKTALDDNECLFMGCRIYTMW